MPARSSYNRSHDRRRFGCLFGVAICVALLLACGLGLGMQRAGVVEPPELTLSVGPIALATGRIVDTSCAEPLIPCETNPLTTEGPAYYAIWIVMRTGPDAHQYRHLSLHLPLRRIMDNG